MRAGVPVDGMARRPGGLICGLVLGVVFYAQDVTLAGPAEAGEDGLLLRWGFDEGAGLFTADGSPSDSEGEIAPAVRWVRGGFGTALRFGGKDCYVAAPRLEGLDGSDELTVQVWVYWEGTGRYPNIFTGGQWSPGGFLIFVRDRYCSFRMGRPGHAANVPGQQWREVGVKFLDPFPLKEWVHLTATFKRPAIRTYVNGKQVGSASWDYPVAHGGDLLVGTWTRGVCHEGLIDDVRVYNRALSPEAVAESYAAAAGRYGAGAPGDAPYEILSEQLARPEPVHTLETRFFSLGLDGRGQCVTLVDKATGTDHLARPMPLVQIRTGGRVQRRSTLSVANGRLSFAFSRPDVTVVLGVREEAEYAVFEVISVAAPEVEIDEVTFVTLPVALSRYVSAMSCHVGDDEFGVCLRALDLDTRVTIGRVGGRALRASAVRDYGFPGCKAALVAAPADRLRQALGRMVRREGVPYSRLGGPFGLDARETRGSYMFARVSEANVEEWIDVVRRAGFTHVHFSGWARSLGHYEPREKLFPGGIEGMKETVRTIHAAGLKAGIHTLTGCIATNDPWVTPVPDPRLVADAGYTLAEAADATGDKLLTVEKPERHDTIWSYAGSGNVVRLGSELVHYSAISYEPPFGFFGCTRGAFKSTPSAHPKGARADHLQQRYLAFYPDESSTLVGEVADAIARVFNTCEMDEIYMDGAEGMRGWHPVAVMRNAIYSRLKRPALVEASSWGAWSWYYHSRVGAWDHPKWGLKRFVDMHCKSARDFRKSALVEAQLGWWAILGPSVSGRGETPDEIEYLCGKTLAMDAPMSIQGVNVGSRPPNARQDEYFTAIGRYERLRLANYFSDALKQRLAEPRAEFRLSRADDGQWQFVPTDYAVHKVTALTDGSATWRVTNRFAEQPVRLRVEALYTVVPYDSPDAVVLEGFGAPAEFKVNADARDVSHSFTATSERVRAGGVSARIAAANKGESPEGAWAKAGRRFDPHADMGRGEALGLWVHGDGKGEVLNVQLSNPREYSHAYAEHYVKIDFEGWRYVELLLRERDSGRYHDYTWPYFSQHGIFRTRLTKDHIHELNLYLNNIPADGTAEVLLSPIKALRIVPAVLRNPEVRVGAARIVLPVALDSGHYVELESMDDCRVYDARGVLLQRLRLPGPAPVLVPGENEIAFSCQGLEGRRARAEVTVVSSGPALRGKRADGEIDWGLLKREYDPPRTVLATDGRDNRWRVLSCPDRQSARLELELRVDAIEAGGAAYESSGFVTVADFDGPTEFADSPTNLYAKYVYDSKHKGIPAKPGVTRRFETGRDGAKIGRGCGRYVAASTRRDGGGWCAVGKRFPSPLDLSSCQAIGFWLKGDGQGESFKVQLRDVKGAWHDMVTRVDFSGWRYREFDLASAGLDLGRIEYVLLFYNSIPAGATVTCEVDDIRALGEPGRLARPVFSVGGRALVFPVDLSVGDRLVFRDMRDCVLYRRGRVEAQPVRPVGRKPRLEPGHNDVLLDFAEGSPRAMRVRAAITKVYR